MPPPVYDSKAACTHKGHPRFSYDQPYDQPYDRVDLSVRYRLPKSKRVQLYFNATDLTNRGNKPRQYRTLGPTDAFLSSSGFTGKSFAVGVNIRL
ncbi:MAG: TonB-dependent receptor [Proteobacteria bacterium]|nr:TonB-dependent receptor [Pseudomonadota bacterium]